MDSTSLVEGVLVLVAHGLGRAAVHAVRGAVADPRMPVVVAGSESFLADLSLVHGDWILNHEIPAKLPTYLQDRRDRQVLHRCLVP